MALELNNSVGEILINENDTHATPPTGSVAIYAKTGGRIYGKDSAGNEFSMFSVQGVENILVEDWNFGYESISDAGGINTRRYPWHLSGGANANNVIALNSEPIGDGFPDPQGFGVVGFFPHGAQYDQVGGGAAIMSAQQWDTRPDLEYVIRFRVLHEQSAFAFQYQFGLADGLTGGNNGVLCIANSGDTNLNAAVRVNGAGGIAATTYPVSDNTWRWLRFTWTNDWQTLTLYNSPDGVNWTQTSTDTGTGHGIGTDVPDKSQSAVGLHAFFSVGRIGATAWNNSSLNGLEVDYLRVALLVGSDRDGVTS